MAIREGEDLGDERRELGWCVSVMHGQHDPGDGEVTDPPAVDRLGQAFGRIGGVDAERLETGHEYRSHAA